MIIEYPNYPIILLLTQPRENCVNMLWLRNLSFQFGIWTQILTTTTQCVTIELRRPSSYSIIRVGPYWRPLVVWDVRIVLISEIVRYNLNSVNMFIWNFYIILIFFTEYNCPVFFCIFFYLFFCGVLKICWGDKAPSAINVIKINQK